MLGMVMCVYNTLPVFQKSIEAALKGIVLDDTVIVLVDNCSPDPRASELAQRLPEQDKRCFCVQPGRNVGVNLGWNYGFEELKRIEKQRGQRFDLVGKLDDDTVILTAGWDKEFTETAARLDKRLTILAADGDAQKKYDPTQVRDGIVRWGGGRPHVGFSCVVFRREALDTYGPLMSGAYGAFPGRAPKVDRFYGGQETRHCMLARANGHDYCLVTGIKFHHQGNAERDPDYPLWKLFYGYHGWTDDDLDGFRKSPDYLPLHRKLIEKEIPKTPLHHAGFVKLAIDRLRIHSADPSDLALLERAAKIPELADIARAASREIGERVQVGGSAPCKSV
jgi:glycosyltransferase involved in cell wall biosynthesis